MPKNSSELFIIKFRRRRTITEEEVGTTLLKQHMYSFSE